ncbi:MAG: hypothetical protein ABIJ81_04520 [Patescibacteria group bacterium]
MNTEPRKRSSKQPGDGLKLISYCPLCEKSYNPLRARILDERDGAHLVHIQCAECGSSIVALIMASSMGITSVGLITDLTGDDVMKFKDESRLTADEVISMHQMLFPQKV